MAAELLQILSAAKSLNDQNASAQAINQHARLLDQHTGLLNHQAQAVEELTAVVRRDSQDLRILRAKRDGDAFLLHACFWILLVTIVALSLAGTLWVTRLHKRVARLESLIAQPPAVANSGTPPTALR